MNTRDLPPLPTPWEYVYEWQHTPFGIHRSFSANHWNGAACTRQVVVFTADQMRAYAKDHAAAAALAERERCAKLLERTGNDHCAAAIRTEPKEQQP